MFRFGRSGKSGAHRAALTEDIHASSRRIWIARIESLGVVDDVSTASHRANSESVSGEHASGNRRICSMLRSPASDASAGVTLSGTCPSNRRPTRRASSAAAKKTSRGRRSSCTLMKSTPRCLAVCTIALASASERTCSDPGHGLSPRSIWALDATIQGPTSRPAAMSARHARTSSIVGGRQNVLSRSAQTVRQSPVMSRTPVTPNAT